MDKKKVLIGFSGNPELNMDQLWSDYTNRKKNLASAANWGLGGTSVDWALALRELGASVHSKLLLSIGQDDGDMIRYLLTQLLDKAGVDFHPFPVLDCTNIAFIQRFTDTKETRINGYKGGYLSYPTDEVASQVEIFAPDYCIATGVETADVPMVEKLFDTNAYRILNPRLEALAHKSLVSVLKSVDLLIMNDAEMSVLLRIDYPTVPTEHIMSQILSQGPKEIIVTCGAKGSYYADKSGVFLHQPIVKNNDATTDATGVGDCFAAAFFTKRVEQATIAESLAFAACAASLKMSLPTGSNIPARGVVDKLLKMGFAPDKRE